jgi:hypothetical protein
MLPLLSTSAISSLLYLQLSTTTTPQTLHTPLLKCRQNDSRNNRKKSKKPNHPARNRDRIPPIIEPFGVDNDMAAIARDNASASCGHSVCGGRCELDGWEGGLA